MKVFPERLRLLRQDNGLTQAELALKLNISEGKYKEFEKSGRKFLDDATATQCADIFNTTVDYILGRTDDPTNYSNPYIKEEFINGILQEEINRRVQEILKNGHDDSIKYT